MIQSKKHGIIGWVILFLLGGVWGSSFILMKISSRGLNSFEISAMRNFTAGIFLLPYYVLLFKKLDRTLWRWILTAALLGSGIPSVFYAYSSKYIDSNINGVINSLTPIFTLLVGIVWLKTKTSRLSHFGLFVGFFGVFILLASRGFEPKNMIIAILPLVSTLFYGINVNLIKEKLSHLSSIDILTAVFGTLCLFSIPILFYNHTFEGVKWSLFQLHFWTVSSDAIVQKHNSLLATMILGLIGTSLASFLFYYLLRRTSALFASMNTYLIPLMSIFWGFLDGESIGWMQFLSLIFILIGVYLVSKRK